MIDEAERKLDPLEADEASVTPRPRLLLVDDDPVLRRQLARALAARGLDVTALDAPDQALDRLAHADLDGSLVDLRLGDACGLALLARLRAERPDLPLGLMSGHDLRDHLNDAARIGALAFTKPLRTDDLAAFLRSVRRHSRDRRSPLDRLELSHLLARRERQCSERAVRHETHREIGEALGIRPNSVRTYVQRALDKLGFDSISEVRRQLKELERDDDL